MKNCYTIVFVCATFLSGVGYSGEKKVTSDVVFKGEVGDSVSLEGDMTAALNAVAANLKEFEQLASKGRIGPVKIEIFPAVDENHSNITQYTFSASFSGGLAQPAKTFSQLVLRSHYDKRIQDHAPLTWSSSGIKEIKI